jgi:hypothetical protein
MNSHVDSNSSKVQSNIKDSIIKLPWWLHATNIKKWVYKKSDHGTINEFNYIILT